LVVPTSIRVAPLLARIEGTRKSPPMATSSPRETATLCPFPTVSSARRSAAAAFVTARASTSSRPGAKRARRSGRTCSPRRPLSPVWVSYSSVQYPLARRTASMAAAASGARPRFVWSRTPVALTTGLGPAGGRCRSSVSAAARRRPVRASGEAGASSTPSRRRAAASRSVSLRRVLPNSAASLTPSGCERRLSMEGGRRTGSLMARDCRLTAPE
jgi:hypothetical protein